MLGWVLSMELIGMAVGSVAFGSASDKFGRRPCILICLALMAGGMFGATFAGSVPQLSAYRILTGLGIGGMLASLTAIVSEYANDRWRPVVIATMIVGYPIGTVLGGLVARHLLVVGDWRHVLLFGAVMTPASVPFVGVGRAGAAFGPAAAGALFAADLSLPVIALAMSIGPLIGATIIWALFRASRQNPPRLT